MGRRRWSSSPQPFAAVSSGLQRIIHLGEVPTIEARRKIPCAVFLVTALLSSAATACHRARTPANERTREVEVRAIVDTSRGLIELPLDHFSLSYDERRTVEFAIDLALQGCMERVGFEYPAIDRRSDPPPTSRRYGVWVPKEARATGYAPPAETSSATSAERENARPLSPDEGAALERCAGSDLLKQMTLDEPLPGDEAAFRIYAEALSSDQGQEAIQEWRECLIQVGVETSDDIADVFIPLEVVGSLPNLTPAHRRVAAQDILCKTRTNLVSRLATLEAERQKRVIADYRDELEAQRRRVDAAVRVARATIRRAETM